MIGAYLQKDGARWEAQKRNQDGSLVLTETGQRTFLPPTTIPARVQGKVKLVRTPTGEQVPTQAEITTTAKVAVGDLVDGREVLAMEQRNTLTGSEAWRVVYT